MKIILGVDDSTYSEAAVQWVKRMSWPRNTKIVVISVARPPIGAYAEVYVPQPSLHQQVMEQEVRLHRDLSQHAGQYCEDAGLSYHCGS